MILTAFSHGLRATEVISLKVNDIADGFLRAKRLKGSLTTVQPLIESKNPLLNEKKALLEFASEMHGNQVLFPVTRQRFWQIMQEHAEAAGLPRHLRHPHCLKHTIAMRTIGLGAEICRQYLGHRSLNSTGAYTRVSDETAARAVSTVLKS